MGLRSELRTIFRSEDGIFGILEDIIYIDSTLGTDTRSSNPTIWQINSQLAV